LYTFVSDDEATQSEVVLGLFNIFFYFLLQLFTSLMITDEAFIPGDSLAIIS
jgi:hypothetical protein